MGQTVGGREARKGRRKGKNAREVKENLKSHDRERGAGKSKPGSRMAAVTGGRVSPRAGIDALASGGPAKGKRNIENLERRFADIERREGCEGIQGASGPPAMTEGEWKGDSRRDAEDAERKEMGGKFE